MKSALQRPFSIIALVTFGLLAFYFLGSSVIENSILAQTSPTAPILPSTEFDQKAALAKLRDQIKGREQEPADKVFKNLQLPALKAMPAARLLGVMELGYARSLGVNCTLCHTPEKWESEDKTQKQTARDMWGMMGKINNELLKNIKNLKSESPTVNCTTCHRGQVKPALDMPAPAK